MIRPFTYNYDHGVFLNTPANLEGVAGGYALKILTRTYEA